MADFLYEALKNEFTRELRKDKNYPFVMDNHEHIFILKKKLKLYTLETILIF